MNEEEIWDKLSRLSIGCGFNDTFTLTPETLISEYHKILTAIISIEESEEFKRVRAKLEVLFKSEGEVFYVTYDDMEGNNKDFIIPCPSQNYEKEILIELMKKWE